MKWDDRYWTLLQLLANALLLISLVLLLYIMAQFIAAGAPIAGGAP